MRPYVPTLALLILSAGCAEKDLPSPVAGAPAPAVGTARQPLFRIPLGRSPVRGRADAKISIVIFSDVQCPFCRRVLGTLDGVRRAYPDEVRIVFKHLPLPFHRRAVPAALALEAAGEQGKFWEMHDRLFANQRSLGDSDLLAHARALGLDVNRFEADLKDPALRKRVDADVALAKRFGVRGTPTLFINGRLLRGAQPLERLRAIIAPELARADRALRGGVPRASLYSTLVAHGLERTVKKAASPSTSTPRRPGSCAGRETEAALPKAVHVPVGDSPARGPADAPVTLVLFSDLECPFCKRIEPTLSALEKAFPGKIRVVWKNKPLPFHRNARAAAAALHAAGAQGKFWEMHGRIVASARRPTAKVLLQMAADLGLDVDQFRNEMRSARVVKTIAADLRLAASLGVRGTPTTFVNGRKVAGAVPFAKLKKIVEHELERL